ncbi:MAG: hypothetical protein LJE95_00985 [Acidobacteria bacterium]|jgi:hypothetical protein|nr:hypothetical protein [Acidobacteriota bacterium]
MTFLLYGLHKLTALERNVIGGNLGPWRWEYWPHDWKRRLEQAPAVAAESIIPTRCLATAGDARRAIALDRTAAGVSDVIPTDVGYPARAGPRPAPYKS